MVSLAKRESVCGLLLMGLISTLFVSGSVLSSAFVSADDHVDDVTITIPSSCTLSGTGLNSHNATINNGQYNSAVGLTTIKAFCNDPEGFAIYAIGYTNDIDGANVLTSSTVGSATDIATGTLTSGPNSQWAMKLAADSGQTYPVTLENGFDAFHTVPNEHTLVATRASGTDTGTLAIGSTITATYQVYISSTQIAGTYYGQVKYMMVHPSNANVNWVLNYNANGGTNAPAAGRGFVTGDSYNFRITSDEPTRDGYIFTGWSESSSATIAEYSAGDTYTATTASSTLYAVWVEDRSISIVFDGNSATAGSMATINSMYWQEYIDNGIRYGDEVNLPASNYSRAGYGFAGWSTTQLNPNGGTFATDFATLAANDGIYGPNETVYVDGVFMSEADSNDAVTLYAVWVPVARTSGNTELTFQTTNLFTTTLSDSTTLASKPVGYVTALKDVRDNEVYAITKLSDGSWWMIENLRLDLGTANITSSNTNNPKASFLSEIANVSSSDLWCDNYMQPSDATCNNRVLYNTSNLDRALTASPHNVTIDWTDLNAASWYSYGVYYNAYAATAGYGDFDFRWYWDDDASIQVTPSAEGDICPASWRLPVMKNINSSADITSFIPGSIYSLWGILGGNTSKTYLDALDTDEFLSFPYNFVYSGDWEYDRQDNNYLSRGGSGSFWTSTVGYSDPGSNKKDGVEYSSGWIDHIPGWEYGFTIRCVAVP